MSKKEVFMKEYLPYIIIIIVVLLIKIFIVTPIRVNGPSMLDTLEDKDIEDFGEFLDNETELDIDAFSDREN